MGIEGEVARLLAESGKRVAVAEACTGGLLGSLLTSVPGSSRYFLGGVIAYANQVKEQVLGVPPEAFREGAVSAPVALEMARRVRLLLDADVGLSATGIAGPGGGTPTKPVGLAYIALSARDGYEEVVERRWEGDREGNRRRTAEEALFLLHRYLERGR